MRELARIEMFRCCDAGRRAGPPQGGTRFSSRHHRNETRCIREKNLYNSSHRKVEIEMGLMFLLRLYSKNAKPRP